MKLFGRKQQPHPAGEAVAEATAARDYDAQSDLALPSTSATDVVDDGFVPFAGEVVPEGPAAAYDTDRDLGL